MGLRDDLLNEPVSSLPFREPIRLPLTAPVRAAVAAMREGGEGCVVVTNDHGTPEGNFTEHQIAGLVARGGAFLDEPISRHIRDAWAKVRHSEPITNLIHKLQDYGLRYVTVVDDAGKAIGVLGQKALMDFISEYFPLQVKTQDMEAKVSLEKREGA